MLKASRAAQYASPACREDLIPLKTRDEIYVNRPGQGKVGQGGIKLLSSQVVLVDAVVQDASRLHDGHSFYRQGDDNQGKFWFSR